ncbi:helix-turn-helix domain-containing protein [Chitinophaga filiformis]|uniref:helix-turn-helix domain-containing protein n=1 Tax=Chitinophaga filiformis TaxID=104663 RepID=UPI001F28E232|nr:helix-turn-helix transcriptional regulator [Chitinophaga filiformis]MCF6407511.1 helix-turn-helix domain-containing protein [Chitinophaga filiformis]
MSDRTSVFSGNLFNFILMNKDEEKDYQYILDRVGQRLVKYRKSRNMSARQLAAETGFDQAWLTKVEKGQKDLRLTSVYKLAEQTTGDVFYFLREEE